ncbi:MAG TPA: metalloregulator ArsR/SmtB family transcription factor [Puia sp.]|nr:metalloregulator ArsR/SmtB family transcription factor [Puia sp.]
MNGTVSNYWMILNAHNGEDSAVKVDFINLKKAAMILRALNHKLRQQIVRALDEHKRLTVTELYIQLRLEQSVASQHLAILRRAGIVKTERDGKFIHYTINPARIADIVRTVQMLIV